MVTVVSSQTEHAPCWLALTGASLYCSNTPSKSISRYKVSDNSLTLAEPIAAKIQDGEPTDIAAEGEIVAVLDLGKGAAHLSQFKTDNTGKLKLLNTTPTASGANGIAIMYMDTASKK